MAYVFADLDDLGRELMTKDLRQSRGREDVRGSRSDNRARDVFMKISTANAGP